MVTSNNSSYYANCVSLILAFMSICYCALIATCVYEVKHNMLQVAKLVNLISCFKIKCLSFSMRKANQLISTFNCVMLELLLNLSRDFPCDTQAMSKFDRKVFTAFYFLFRPASPSETKYTMPAIKKAYRIFLIFIATKLIRKTLIFTQFRT